MKNKIEMSKEQKILITNEQLEQYMRENNISNVSTAKSEMKWKFYKYVLKRQGYEGVTDSQLLESLSDSLVVKFEDDINE